MTLYLLAVHYFTVHFLPFLGMQINVLQNAVCSVFALIVLQNAKFCVSIGKAPWCLFITGKKSMSPSAWIQSVTELKLVIMSKPMKGTKQTDISQREDREERDHQVSPRVSFLLHLWKQEASLLSIHLPIHSSIHTYIHNF